MIISDVMTVFRQIIGYIARIDKCGFVKIEHIAQDMGVEIADVRLWLMLMDFMRIVTVDIERDVVILKLMRLDYLGFDLKDEGR
jgi:hypothetical protein